MPFASELQGPTELRFVLPGLVKVYYGAIHHDIRHLERGVKMQAFQGPATAQCHVYLSRGKRSGKVQCHTVKGQTLTLVNGYSPGQPEWILGKTPDFLLDDFLFFIELVSKIFPFDRLNFDEVFHPASDHDDLFANLGHYSDFPIDILAILIVTSNKHNLRALYQGYGRFHREGGF